MFSRDTWQGSSNLAALIAISGGIVVSIILGYTAQWLGLIS